MPFNAGTSLCNSKIEILFESLGRSKPGLIKESESVEFCYSKHEFTKLATLKTKYTSI